MARRVRFTCGRFWAIRKSMAPSLSRCAIRQCLFKPASYWARFSGRMGQTSLRMRCTMPFANVVFGFCNETCTWEIRAMNFKAAIILIFPLAIPLGLFSCATQQKAAAPDQSQAASAKAPAQAQEVKQSQGPGIVKSQAGVPFMSGGFGVEERNQMRQAAKS